MVGVSKPGWESLERWCGTIFLVAGVLLLFTAVGFVLEVVTDMALQGPILGIPQFLGLLVGYVGLLGLYSLLRDTAPRLALAGVVLVVAPVVTIVLVLVHALTMGGEPPFADTIFMVIGVGFAVGIALFGVASLRTETPSRGVGVCLLVWAVPFLLLVGLGAENSATVDLVISALNAVAVLGIGYLLRTQRPSTRRGESAPGPTP